MCYANKLHVDNSNLLQLLLYVENNRLLFSYFRQTRILAVYSWYT